MALREHEHDVGTLVKLLAQIPDRDLWCMEIGAWDGAYLSSSRDLIAGEGYKAVLIEADRRKFDGLSRLYAGRSDIHCLNALAGWSATDGLDQLLANTSIPSISTWQ